MAKQSNAQILNVLRATQGDTFRERIPAQTQENWNQWGLALATEDYTYERNCFLRELLNKIGLTIIQKGTPYNKLAHLKKGEYTLGDSIEQIFVDIIQAYPFECNMEPDQFEKFPPNVYTMYHRETRADFYPNTIQEKTMRKAFTEEYGLANLIDMILAATYSSAALDEYLMTKQMFMKYRYHTASVPGLRPAQFKTVAPITDRATGEDFYIALKTGINDLTFPTRDFNPAGVMHQNTVADLELFVHKDITPILDVKALSVAFNRDNLTPSVPITILDDFGTAETEGGPDNSDVIAILADKNFFLIYDQLHTMRVATNARGLYENYFYHVWQTYAASYFHNVIFFLGNNTARKLSDKAC